MDSSVPYSILLPLIGHCKEGKSCNLRAGSAGFILSCSKFFRTWL